MSYQYCAQVRTRDLVILPHVWEHYDNITHQTLEATRAAALDPAMTHLLKVPCTACTSGLRSVSRCTGVQAVPQCHCVLVVAQCSNSADSWHAQRPQHCCTGPSAE
jgi:hypothetical protein